MPKPSLPVDWEIVRSLYLQGIDPKEISGRFGIKLNTLRAKACKKGWSAVLNREKESKATVTEKGTQIARDIWSERREVIRERIHLIGDRMTKAASELPEDQILNKADKIKIATEIAGKSVGLDREEDKNQVNIAILGAIDSRPSSYGEIIEGEVWSESGRKLPSNRVTHTESESVTHHPTHHGHP